MFLPFEKLRDVKSPERGTGRSAGVDFFIPEDFNNGNPEVVRAGQAINIPSGIRMSIPSGYTFIAFNKSGVALNKGLQVGACVIDEDYQGEIHLHLVNTSNRDVAIHPGEKIVQFVLVPTLYFQPREVNGDIFQSETERGEGGFGSTGT